MTADGQAAAARAPLADRLRRRWRDRDPSHLALGVTVAGLAVGGAGWLAGWPVVSAAGWGGATAAALVPLTVAVARDLRHGRTGVDLIALLAMAGSLALRELLAGAVIALMLSGGQVLERRASARARRELSALAERAPKAAHRYRDGALATVPVDEVRPGDRLLVKPGEVVPVDGAVAGGAAVVDESALTGEAAPVVRRAGETARSGTVNAGGPFELRAVATAEESTYAGIVRLTREAQASRAPLVRMADRYATVFLPFTIALAAGAWLVSGDPVRALAVLVVATPCPLILAAPIAIVAGISRAASRGVVVKGGGALEGLARAAVVLFDKTGTLTVGQPILVRAEAFGGTGEDDVVRLAASLDQVSPHVLAAAIVGAARDRALPLAFPDGVREVPGQGIEGRVGGRRVAVGKAAWVSGGAPLPDAARRVRRRVSRDGQINVFVAVDGQLAGALVLEDRLRRETPRAVHALREAGVRQVLVVTGDRADLAEAVGRAIGADGILAEMEPGEKLGAVRQAAGRGTVVMVGDGINDAPALAAADVGVAMGARGATASSEAADVVVTVDRLDRLPEAVRIARRARRVALQSVVAGMGLSMAAMLVAAAGWLIPVAGALLQEAIDVVVILNALRALRVPRPPHAGPGEAAVRDRVEREHARLSEGLEQLRATADGLGRLPSAESRAYLERDHRFLVEQVLPHERAEASDAFPLVEAAVGGDRPTASLRREHAELAAMVAALGQVIAEMGPEGPTEEELPDLRRLLYGLDAALRLHTAAEDEAYLPLAAGEG
jgi:heavy metal translocating P-type ATPase